jgi:mRNA-degrading endonuclease HigB of HigAB toxin-antitoxin module
MRFLGYTEAASFIAQHPLHGDTLRAWVSEIQYRDWRTPRALTADFRSAEVTPPLAVFRLGTPPLRIETIVDFRNRIVLLTGIRTPMNIH